MLTWTTALDFHVWILFYRSVASSLIWLVYVHEGEKSDIQQFRATQFPTKWDLQTTHMSRLRRTVLHILGWPCAREPFMSTFFLGVSLFSTCLYETEVSRFRRRCSEVCSEMVSRCRFPVCCNRRCEGVKRYALHPIHWLSRQDCELCERSIAPLCWYWSIKFAVFGHSCSIIHFAANWRMLGTGWSIIEIRRGYHFCCQRNMLRWWASSLLGVLLPPHFVVKSKFALKLVSILWVLISFTL